MTGPSDRTFRVLEAGCKFMVQRKAMRWNVLTIVSVLVAFILALSALAKLDVTPVRSRDLLRLTSASRALTTASGQGAGGWSSVRGERLNEGEQRVDQQSLEQAEHHVQVGVYVTSTYDLNLSIPSFSSNGYVWLHWDEPLQRYLEGRQTTIDERIKLLNGLLSDADPVLQPFGDEGAEQLEDGSYYQLFTYIGRFYIDLASFRHYPFTTVSLPLALEVNDVDGLLDYSHLRLEPDIQNSGMGLYAGVIGWLNRGWSIAEYRHQYASNFGRGGIEEDYSQVVFDIALGTSAWASFWRLMLPLVILMAMVLLVFKVRPDEQDARASIPVTVLLTLVFLQQTYRSEIPHLPFLTFIDQTYVLSYVVTLAAFVMVIWIGRRYQAMEAMPEGTARDLLRQHLNRLDEVWPLGVVMFGTAGVVISWLSLPPGA